MMRPPPKSAVVRARWLTELAVALDEAHRLTLWLTEFGAGTQEAVVLRVRIQAMMTEVESLRRGNYARTTKHEPIWTDFGNFLSEVG